jgi:NAD(P)-dependent dehydrogenase (short-subunit alcohol dehydrogenase family)
MLFTISLAHRWGHRGLTAISLHPGVIGTKLGDHIDWSKEFGDLGKSRGQLVAVPSMLLLLIA